jgi:diguanylate cyclase (GGDEF)-like protein/PAS domain S-box-containing protein
MKSQSVVGNANTLRHLEAMRFINRIATHANSLDDFLVEILDQMLGIFACDRAWLMYPCDPDGSSWGIRMERTRPEWPGGFAMGTDFPMTPIVQTAQRAMLVSQGPVKFDSPRMAELVPLSAIEAQFSIRAQLTMSIHPKTDKAWVLGIHHCAQPYAFSDDEVSLFEDIGNRVSEALNHLLTMDMLKKSERYNRMLFDNSPVGLVLCQIDGSLIDCNHAFAHIVGCESATYREWQTTSVQGWQSKEQLDELKREGFLDSYESELVHKSGRRVPVLINASLVKRGDEQNMLFCIEDITERKRIEQALRDANARLEALSRHDPLTGLGNRNELEDAWRKVANRSERSNKRVALLLLDLNNFKPINDKHGHIVGDLVLQEVAARLLKVMRASDTVVRLGGDEFVVLVDEITGHGEIEPLKMKIADAITEPIEINGNTLVVGVSIGSAIHPTDAATLSDLLHQADVGMYRHKTLQSGCR